MRVLLVGIGLLVVSTTVVIPYVASERCKDRWTAFSLDAVWDYKTGCSVKIGSSLVREEYVIIDSGDHPTSLPIAPNQALAHPDWVVIGPDKSPVAEGSVRINPR